MTIDVTGAIKQAFSSRAGWLVASLLGLMLPRAYLLYKFRDSLIHSDEAIVGLMGRHILRGDFPIWYYGQNFMGSIEAVSAAVLFALFGATPLILKLTAFCWFCAFLFVEYLLAREIAGRTTARAVTLVLAASPAFLTLWSLMPMGGYMSLLFLGTSALLIVVRAINRGLTTGGAALLGFTVGLAWWTNFLAIAYIVPVLLILAFAVKGKLISRTGALMMLCFLIGSLPFWVYNIPRLGESLRLRMANPVPFLPGLRGFFRTAVPILLGTRPEYGRADFFPSGSVLALLLFALAVVLPLRRELSDAPSRLVPNARVILLGMLLFVPFLFVATGRGGTGDQPRYLIPLYSAVYILLLSGVRRRAVQLALIGILLIVNVSGTLRATIDNFATSLNAEPNRPLIEFLRRNHVRTAYAPYWIAYRLTFESKEEIICTPPAKNDFVRYRPYLEIASADPRPAYIQLSAPKYGGTFSPLAPPADYTRTRIGNYDVFLAPPIAEDKARRSEVVDPARRENRRSP